MRGNLTRGAAIVAVLALLSGAGGAAGAAPASGKPTVTIGVSGSFSGATAFYGQAAQAGAQLAVDQLNARDPKYAYKLVATDDACTPDGGAQAFNNLIDARNVDVILGSPCSAATLAGMAVLPKSQTPALTQSSTNPTISAQSGVGGNPYMWRIILDDALMAKVFAKYIADQGIKRVGLIGVNNDYGRGGVTAYKAEFPKNGVTIVEEQYYTQGSGEFRPQLTKIGGARPDAMLDVGASQDAAVMVRQFKELGLTFKIFTRGDVVSTTFQETAKDPCLGNGIQEATNWDGSNSVVALFYKDYRAKYNANPLSYAGQSYYAVEAIAQAVYLGGPGRAGIQRGLSKVNWQSPLGRIKFDDHNQAHGNMFIEEFASCQIRLAKTVSAY